MSKKTITYEQFAAALEYAIEEAFRIDLTDYYTWSNFQDWKRFAWRALDKRKKWHKNPVNQRPEPHVCPIYVKQFKLFGVQYYSLRKPGRTREGIGDE
jgi:hypothetical protein